MPASAALREASLHEMTLAGPPFGTVPSAGSRLVIAVGSNAAPDVLRRKLAHVPSTDRICLRTVRVTNITVGHSAHVAARGYIPAAPILAGEGAITTTAAWLGPTHIDALDATEPNYDRQTVTTRDHPVLGRPSPLLPDEWTPPATFDLYVSRHGVLADPVTGDPVPFDAQTDVLEWLSRRLDDATLARPASQVCSRLSADPRAMTTRIRAAGLARSHGSRAPLSIGDGR